MKNRIKDVSIEQGIIGSAYPPFIIAEMSGNHNQSIAQALKIVDLAAKSGCHALKIQTYTADTMTIDVDKKEFFIQDVESLWKGKSLYKLYREAHTPWEWHKKIFNRCRKIGIIGFSTPFDATAVDFLESLSVPCYKIASFEIVDIPLIIKVASTGKPILMSTGMATIKEIDEAVKAAKKAGCKDIILLKCTSAYPASPDNANVLTIPDMQKRFNCQVGISDHTLGIGVAVSSIALGARVIEKHFTLSRKEGGVDSAFSMEPEEMKLLVNETKQAWRALGEVKYGPTKQESDSIKYRRSLYVVKDMKTGDPLTQGNLKSIRPGYGLQPKHYDSLLGRRVKFDIQRGSAFSWDMLDNDKKYRSKREMRNE